MLILQNNFFLNIWNIYLFLIICAIPVPVVGSVKFVSACVCLKNNKTKQKI